MKLNPACYNTNHAGFALTYCSNYLSPFILNNSKLHLFSYFIGLFLISYYF